MRVKKLSAAVLLAAVCVVFLCGDGYPYKVFKKSGGGQTLYTNLPSLSGRSLPSPVSPVIFYVKPGSLRKNLAKFLNAYGWKTPQGEWWVPSVDYVVAEGFTLKGRDVFDAVNRLLESYPLKAEFFLRDMTVRIVPVDVRAQ